jgi:hypothetical protein
MMQILCKGAVFSVASAWHPISNGNLINIY